MSWRRFTKGPVVVYLLGWFAGCVDIAVMSVCPSLLLMDINVGLVLLDVPKRMRFVLNHLLNAWEPASV
jgi:hypothetical protein